MSEAQLPCWHLPSTFKVSVALLSALNSGEDRLTTCRRNKGLSMWSKDIVLLFADGDLEGTQAWLRAYYGSTGKPLRQRPTYIPGVT